VEVPSGEEFQPPLGDWMLPLAAGKKYTSFETLTCSQEVELVGSWDCLLGFQKPLGQRLRLMAELSRNS
jgi:hypothetical protein